MKENKLITTNSLWYRIKNFFRKVFNVNEYDYAGNKEIETNPESNFQKSNLENLYKIEIDEKTKKEKMANQLFCGGKLIDELTDEELDEMIEYFKQDIQEKTQELNRVKEHIIAMRKQLA